MSTDFPAVWARRMSSRPLGVSILGLIVFFLGASLLVLEGWEMLVFSAFGGVGIAFVESGFVQIVFDLVLAFGFLFLLLGLGLWKGNNLARVFFMLIQVLQALLSLMFLGTIPLASLGGMGVSLLAVGYLHLPRVQTFFEREGRFTRVKRGSSEARPLRSERWRQT